MPVLDRVKADRLEFHPAQEIERVAALGGNPALRPRGRRADRREVLLHFADRPDFQIAPDGRPSYI